MRSIDEAGEGALAVVRADDSREGAEIIDLVQLPAGARPHPRTELDYDEVDDARAMHCSSYADCLSFAASVHWRGFHCRRCARFADCEDGASTATARGPAKVLRLVR